GRVLDGSLTTLPLSSPSLSEPTPSVTALSSTGVETGAPERMVGLTGGSRVAPLSRKSYVIQFTMDEAAHALLREAQELLGNQVVPGDLAAVFGRALQLYVDRLRRIKFAATNRPQARTRSAKRDSRHVRARVKRAVWKRDGGRCTFVSESGHRCD